MLIFITKNCPRVDYVFNWIFNNVLKIDYSFTSDRALFENYSKEKMNYSKEKISNEMFIKSSPLLFENFIETKEIIVAEKETIKIIFPNDDKCDLGFDIFSAVFFMISRYEEYLPFKGDAHGRFQAADSLAQQHHFLQLPVVNYWIEFFKKLLQQKFSFLQIGPSEFSAIMTYDIDTAYKFRGKKFIQTAGSTVKDLLQFRFKNLKSKLMVLLKKQKDPWDVYDNLQQTIQKNKLNSIVFFLLGDASENDRNLPFSHPLMSGLVKKVMQFSDIGIHPSFKSSIELEKITIEKERLEKISGKIINKSRQHFLRFTLPATYNALINAGIQEDYSMAYADKNGFRAGTCTPFYFYDLQNETATNLKIFPVTCMEATSIYYTKTSPEKSLIEILNLLKEVKKAGGTFISIWHNENLGEAKENKSWNPVHDKMIMQVKAFLRNNNRN